MGNTSSQEQIVKAYLDEKQKTQSQPVVSADNYLAVVSDVVAGQPSGSFIIGQSGNSGSLPDPAPGCSKTFTATYSCGTGVDKIINVDAEAAGKSMLFDCTAEAAKCNGFKLTLTDDGNLTLTDNTGKTTWSSGTSKVGIALDKYRAINGKYNRNYLKQGNFLLVGQFMGSPSGNCYLMMTNKGLMLQYEVPSCSSKIPDDTAYSMYSIPRQNIKNIGKIGFVAEDGVLHEYQQPSAMVVPGNSFENIGKFNSLGNDLQITAEKNVKACQAKCLTLPDCGGMVYSENAAKNNDVITKQEIVYNSGGSTNGSYDWTVPKGVERATFTVVGSRGQDTPYGSGSAGAKVTALVNVTENQVYKIRVASKGSSSGPGKCGNITNGYGGGRGNSSNSYGNGGAASVVYLDNLLSPLIVAGGGGGGGFQADGGPAGINTDGSGSKGIGSSGGAGGRGSGIPFDISQTNGFNTTSNVYYTSGGGGGGGGGIFGGGGGGYKGGGGGGGCYVRSGFNVSYTQDTTNVPLITISWMSIPTAEPNCFIKDKKIYPVGLRQKDDNYELYVRNKKLVNNNSCNKEVLETNTQKWDLLPMGEKMSMQTLCSLGAATESEQISLRNKRAELDNLAQRIKSKVQNLRNTDKELLKNLDSNVQTMDKTLNGYNYIYQQNNQISNSYGGLVEDSNLNMTSEMYKNITYSILAVVVVIGATQIYRSTQQE